MGVADIDDCGRPLHTRVLDELGVQPGQHLLDVGCGSGQLCRMAQDRGLVVTGVDRDQAQLARASALVPGARLRRADLHALPLPDHQVDAVSCVQVLMHLPNPLAGLRELARVAARDAPVAVTVWGPPQDCAVGVFGTALAPLLGPPPWTATARHGPPPLSANGRLARLAAAARLTVHVDDDVRVPFEFSDDRAVLASLYASEVGRRALGVAGRSTVRRLVLDGLAPYRRADGGYRLVNTFRLVVGRAGGVAGARCEPDVERG
jgi:SAM-dependent methyltransferase